MFTGIIQEVGTVIRVDRARGIRRLTIAASKTAASAQRLDSISVNGVCVSVVTVDARAFTCELIEETCRLTTLGTIRTGAPVNLEPSLRIGDRLSGHIVLGHIDGMGTVLRRRTHRGELMMQLRLPAALTRGVVSKGPITVDGVSLTVGSTPTASTCRLHLIPETMRLTTLSVRQVGERVNIELDYFAKLIAHMLVFGGQYT